MTIFKTKFIKFLPLLTAPLFTAITDAVDYLECFRSVRNIPNQRQDHGFNEHRPWIQSDTRNNNSLKQQMKGDPTVAIASWKSKLGIVNSGSESP